MENHVKIDNADAFLTEDQISKMKLNIQDPIADYFYPDCCKNCPNKGNGPCWCTLPSTNNPTC